MKKIIIIGLSALLWISSAAQNNTPLKLNLEKNKVYRLNSLTEQTIVQTVNGNQQTVNTKTQYTVSLKMLDATPDFMIAEARIDTMIVRSNTMGKNTLISSIAEGNLASSEASEIMSAIMNRLSKNALYVKLGYNGKAIEIVNAKMISDIVLRDTSLITLKEPLASAIKTQIKGMVSENSFKIMLEMFTYNLPAKQVAAGGKWSILQPMNSGGMNLDIVTEYQLDKLSVEKAEITAVSNIKTAANAVPLKSGGATVTYDDLNGLSKSAIVVSTLTGLPLEIKTKSQISGNLGVSGPGFSMQIPMEINGETKVVALQ